MKQKPKVQKTGVITIHNRNGFQLCVRCFFLFFSIFVKCNDIAAHIWIMLTTPFQFIFNWCNIPGFVNWFFSCRVLKPCFYIMNHPCLFQHINVKVTDSLLDKGQCSVIFLTTLLVLLTANSMLGFLCIQTELITKIYIKNQTSFSWLQCKTLSAESCKSSAVESGTQK